MSYKPYIELFGREHDFRVKYRLFAAEEGGRFSPAFQGVRWNFWCRGHPKGHFFMIYPEFEDENGNLLETGTPIKESGFANMWMLDLAYFDYHKERIEIGTEGTFNEGGPIAECEVVSLNFEKIVRIECFKKKHQMRVSFIRLLAEYNSNISLKPAKLLLESMLDGRPIDYIISNHKVSNFLEKLNELNLQYEVKSRDQ